MRSSKIALLVVGALVALVSFGLVVAGGGLAIAQAFARDDDGFYRTPTGRFASEGVAVTSATIDLTVHAVDGERGRLGDWDLGVVSRIRAHAADGGRLFIGIGRTADVQAYLDGAAYDEVREVRFDPFDVDYRRHAGTATVVPPGDSPIWTAKTVGSGRQQLTWPLADGAWTAVVMNADGSPGVSADVSVGAKTDLLVAITIGLLAGAGVLGLAALALLAGGLAIGRAPQAVTPEAGTAAAPAAPGSYPARLDARLDEPLGRGLWLIKWLLVIPHLIVLAFLWAAFAVLTFAAGVSILFTGRYPRAIFDFNVGVLRWSWRVTYYAFVLGTDKYPPFSLEPDPTYPCDFTVDYPERLSRGLVLVKWWLLALPHFLILALFGDGLFRWTWERSEWDGRGTFGIGLIGILVLVAAVVLLVQGRYPRAVFDLVMGMMRWTYRVYSYVALLRDEYPPFRLDSGGTDPGHDVTPAPPPAPAPDRDDDRVPA